MPRKPKSPGPTRQAPLDDNGLTDQYRRGIVAALPPGIELPKLFWLDLEEAVAAFIALQQHRLTRPPQRELKRWQNIDRLVSELGDELRAIRRQTPWNASDSLWPNRALTALWSVKLKAEAGVIGYEMISRTFHGRKNPHHDFLYGAVCDLWRWHLGQRLAYSRGDKGIPRGPLIRFFAACVGPVLGDAALTEYGIASVIDREKRRLAYFLGRRK